MVGRSPRCTRALAGLLLALVAVALPAVAPPGAGAADAGSRRPVSFDGTARPLAGDFDGDGRDDVLWYGAGNRPDEVWWSTSGGAFLEQPTVVAGVYDPFVLDVEGDGDDDVFWYGPGAGRDRLWLSAGRDHTTTELTVGGTYVPVAGDFDGDGDGDVLWYGPGSAVDVLWRWRSGRFRSSTISAGGSFSPFAGDLDGDGTDDITFVAAGDAPDRRWRGRRDGTFLKEDARLRALPAHIDGDFDGDARTEVLWYDGASRPASRWFGAGTPEAPAAGDVPVVGDVDGDGRDDILWYGPGTRPDELWLAPATAFGPAPARTSFAIDGRAGNFISGGQDWNYLGTGTKILVTEEGGGLLLRIDSDTRWSGRFGSTSWDGRIRPGRYEVPAAGAGDFGGQGRSCINEGLRWFAVDHVAYDAAGALASLAMRFEVRCSTDTAPMRAYLAWRADQPPRPVNPRPAPADLWAPPAGAVPSSGSSLYVQGSQGSWVAGGRTLSYTPRNAVLRVGASGGRLQATIRGDEWWTLDLEAPEGRDLTTGYYGEVNRYPFQNDLEGGMSFSGEGRACNTIEGWFQILRLVRGANGGLQEVVVRFEQHCESPTAPPTRGQLRWVAGPVPPANPRAEPAGTWRPAASELPSTPTYLHVDRTTTWPALQRTVIDDTPSTAIFEVRPGNGSLQVILDGTAGKRFYDFLGPEGSGRLRPGWYGDLHEGYRFNPALGKTDVSAGCGGTSWFAIDRITYTDDSHVSDLAMRFEVRCGDVTLLRGALAWQASQTYPPTNPRPEPAGTWRPSASAITGTGNLVHLESAPGEPLGGGGTYRATAFGIESDVSWVRASVPNADSWVIDAAATVGQALRTGYYAIDVGANPLQGVLAVRGRSLGCNHSGGWFAVDQLERGSTGAVRALTLRFEQRCDGTSAPLRGYVRWRAP